jgi:hypothetical protein
MEYVPGYEKNHSSIAWGTDRRLCFVNTEDAKVFGVGWRSADGVLR